MYITYCDKFVQIELAQGSRLLQKVLEYANKHFSKRYQLSSSLLILDDGERFKKDYLINWTYHATMQSVALEESTTKISQQIPQEKSTPKAQSKPDEITQNETNQNNKKSTKAKQAKEAKIKSNKKSKKDTQNDRAEKAKMTERGGVEKNLADSLPNDSQKSDFAGLTQERNDFVVSTQDALEKNKSANTSTNLTNSTNLRHTDDTELAQILSYSHLPIRIKITNPNTLLKRIKVQIHLSNLGQILVRLPENNRVARRYIHALFGSNILYEVDNEFCISAVGYTESMWEGVMELISSRIIHNIALDFEFNTKKSDSSHYAGFGESGEGFETFLTREEYLLRKCYSELNVDFRDDFAKVKKQYLKLAKKFHPDNAQGKDKNTVEVFEERFKRILDAYNTIKASHTPHADKTTA